MAKPLGAAEWAKRLRGKVESEFANGPCGVTVKRTGGSGGGELASIPYLVEGMSEAMPMAEMLINNTANSAEFASPCFDNDGGTSFNDKENANKRNRPGSVRTT